ncbi:CRTAC1 family protein, partial [Candidatus Poribacteria bacterium]|nr:CRTAC1 family protein [Candidatus Poribacteria bacterium]
MREHFWKLFLIIACSLVSVPTWAGGKILPFAHQIGVGDFMGGLPGAAMFDYDNDGDLDIYVTNGEGFPNQLLENDGHGNFVDVAHRAGVDDRGRGHGVATADIDNDGDVDIYVANDGWNKLYLNNGDGTFTNIAESAGVISKFNSTSCAFADIDNDGYVDLYVGAADLVYGLNELYHNNGDLTFTDITKQTGTAAAYSWAVAFCDYDNDGDPDIFAANDQGLAKEGQFCPIMLFRNDGNLKFTEVTREAGFTTSGSWMGLAFGDYDLDGDLDLFATNLGTSVQFDQQDTDFHALYRNNGDGTFTNVAHEAGVERWEFGWGTAFIDFDNDGALDLYYVDNFLFLGSVDNPGRFFLNNGDGTFTESTAKYGLLTQDKSGKNTIAVGLATGDVNNDGHVDVFVTNAGTEKTPAYPLLFTEKFDDNHWIRIQLEGTVSNRSAIGARVSLTAGGRVQIQEVASGASSFSQHSLALTFGLGGYSQADEIDIRWPSGIIQRFKSVAADQTLKIRESDSQLVVAIEPKGKMRTRL